MKKEEYIQLIKDCKSEIEYLYKKYQEVAPNDPHLYLKRNPLLMERINSVVSDDTLKAVKLYSYPNEFQLAKRSDDIWFYREWKLISKGIHHFPSWSKWKEVGYLKNVTKEWGQTYAQFADAEDCLVLRLYAEFTKGQVMLINFKRLNKTYNPKYIKLPKI